ncbi:hypothetical protein [Novipirellula sp.]|uniref:hypothetical protein n=1 Tax=Novipirellula sp. TaxID=2795430 RepID=UPI0035687A7C
MTTSATHQTHTHVSLRCVAIIPARPDPARHSVYQSASPEAANALFRSANKPRGETLAPQNNSTITKRKH